MHPSTRRTDLTPLQDDQHRLVAGALALHAQMEIAYAELAERVRALEEEEQRPDPRGTSHSRQTRAK